MYRKKQAKKLGKVIKKVFSLYGVEIKIVRIQLIPSLKRYIVDSIIKPGTDIKKVLGHAENVQAALGFPFFRAFKEGTLIRFAVSEYDFKKNSLLAILRSQTFNEADALLPYAIGYTLYADMLVADLAKMYHLLITGPTGTGKSVAIKNIIMSIIVKCPVSFANLLIFDIGATSLSKFDNLPHLSHPIVKDIATGIKVLQALTVEMEDRLTYPESELGERPFIICIIDEFLSMIANDSDKTKPLQRLVCDLLWRSRKAKIRMVLSTTNAALKNAKVDLTMILHRITFQQPNHHGSSTALGSSGAEKLVGDGALLFKSKSGVQYLQGAYVTDEEIDSILSDPPTNIDHSNKFIISLSECIEDQVSVEEVLGSKPFNHEDTKELADIIMWALGRDTVSARQIRMEFRMDKRADALIEKLFQLGIVEKQFSKQPRKVLVREVDDLSSEAMSILTDNGISVNTDNQPDNKMNQIPEEVD